MGIVFFNKIFEWDVSEMNHKTPLKWDKNDYNKSGMNFK
ncbi:hypothetical protein HPCPY3281_1618 [Helicobacter pylori CPY3281]|nr:hypothetical protein HPCPY3281_1618 [Helicobacter pylori CPY3281]